MESAERDIRELHAAWIEAVNGGNLAGLLRMMADDAVFLSPGQAPFGREVFSNSFTTAHQHSRIRCRSGLEEVVVAGDLAYTLCEDSLSVTARADGKSAQLSGHRITIYRRQSDGRWLLARDAHSLAPVPS